MGTDMRAHVLQLLKSYQDQEHKIALLHYELKHLANISPDGVITAMSYAHGDSTSRRLGHICNKTLYIALNYQEQTDKLNTGTVNEIARQLMDLERVQAQLDYCISLLDRRQKQVILALYIEGLKMEGIEQRLNILQKRFENCGMRLLTH